MNMEVSFVCSVNGLANAMRQVNIRRADADSARPFADIHDSVQRMLGFLSLLLIVDEIQDVGAVLDGIVSSQHDDTGRAAISHALAGRAEYLAAPGGCESPHCHRPSLNTALQTGQIVGSGSLSLIR
jgi:hypothetical protein